MILKPAFAFLNRFFIQQNKIKGLCSYPVSLAAFHSRQPGLARIWMFNVCASLNNTTSDHVLNYTEIPTVRYSFFNPAFKYRNTTQILPAESCSPANPQNMNCFPLKWNPWNMLLNAMRKSIKKFTRIKLQS